LVFRRASKFEVSSNEENNVKDLPMKALKKKQLKANESFKGLVNRVGSKITNFMPEMK